MSSKYTVEFKDGKHTKYYFNTKREARQFAEAMTAKWHIESMVYPTEPEDHNEQDQMERFCMCEKCGLKPSVQDTFLCEDCLDLMYPDME